MLIEYKVPRILWENFESILLAQSKRYIGELAKRLNVPEKELVKRVLPTSDTLKVLIQDSQAECNQCKAYIQHDKMTVYCKKTVAYNSEYCSFHRNKRMHVVEGTNPVEIQRVKDKSNMNVLWINKNLLLNSNGQMVGKINKNKNKISMFLIEDS